MKIILKILKRLGLLQYINITSRIKLNNKSYKIPIVDGLGLSNLDSKSSWLNDVLQLSDNYYKNPVFIDIGVNIGQTLLQVKSLCPNSTYFGFEPNLNCVYYVNKLIKANKFKSTNIFPFAASNTLSCKTLLLNHDLDATATILETLRPNHYNRGIKEQVITLDLDTIFEKCLTQKNIDIIKIDIEGGELFALEGAKSVLKTYMPIIVCEVLDAHSAETIEDHKKRLKKLETLVTELDYNIYQIYRNENDSKIVKLKHISNFEIKIWDAKSLNLNDYLFVSKENKTILKNTIFDSLKS